MLPVEVEVCVNASQSGAVRDAAAAAAEGGAARIELCSEMHLAGLTPADSLIQAARDAFGARDGLLVMIRPRAGDFVYDDSERRLMAAQIQMAAQAGADGVVFGALRQTGHVDQETARRLVDVARRNHLSVTFHRAFDAAPDSLAALREVVELGVQRVLTAGVAWNSNASAVQGTETLRELIVHARRRLEIVIGGGVRPGNAPLLLKRAGADRGLVSLHAYSGVQVDGRTDVDQVRALVAAAQVEG